MLVLVAVLMALTAVTVAVDPPRTRDDPAVATSTPPSTPPPGAGADANSPRARDAVPADERLRTITAERAGQVVAVRPGERLRLRVLSDEVESVQLGTDGPIEAVDRDSPAEFDVLAERGYDAPVRLLLSGRTIGRVTAAAQ